MVTNAETDAQPRPCRFGGLDSAVLLAAAPTPSAPASRSTSASGWRGSARRSTPAARLLDAAALAGAAAAGDADRRHARRLSASHWAVRGEAPGIRHAGRGRLPRWTQHRLLAKAGLHGASRLTRIALGPLAGNPFPDATPEFFAAMAQAAVARTRVADPHRNAAPRCTRRT